MLYVCLLFSSIGLSGARSYAQENTMPQLRLLPGEDKVAFTIYGAPGSVDEVRSLVEFMRENELGRGFDPGPAAVAASAPVIEYLSSIGWPVVLYPPDGGRMQVKGSTSVVSEADELVLRSFDRTGTFNAIQLGEWGYHFHQLQHNEDWWKAVLGNDYGDSKQWFVKPRENRGYDPLPTSRQDCYNQLREYFHWHRQAKKGRLISVTGHSHYEAYAAEWGADIIGLEIGENIKFTQSKFAFARGAARQWNIPWTAQVSPWFGNAVTTRGNLQSDNLPATGLDAGHSLSLYRRLWLHAWFAGAAMVTPENSINFFFKNQGAPWELTSHGAEAARIHKIMMTRDRGNPHTPLLIILDHLAGYAPFHQRTWGVLERDQSDWQIFDLLERQLYFSEARLKYPDWDKNPEADYLHPTPFGEMADVMLNTVAGPVMGKYPYILLAGAMEFKPFFLFELTRVARAGSRILIPPQQFNAIPDPWRGALMETGSLILLEDAGINSTTGRAQVINNSTIGMIHDQSMPVTISGDSIQYQVNKNPNGWVVELINNDGVFKAGDSPAKIWPEATARVSITPRFEPSKVVEWIGNTPLNPGPDNSYTVSVPPGDIKFVEFTTLSNQP